jgi:hypothetical protein
MCRGPLEVKEASVTLAAVWRVQERIYAIADTRISGGPSSVLTEHGPKLLPIQVVCKSDRRIHYSTTLGFAYAGSTLSALATQALANSLFQNLLGQEGARLPQLHELAHTIAEIAYSYTMEIGQTNPRSARFAAIIFGYCGVQRRFRAFELVPHFVESQAEIHIVEHDLEAEHNLIVIGNRPELLRDRVQTERPLFYAGEARPELLTLREIDLPRRALGALIQEGADETVGGALQSAWVTTAGFEIASHAARIDPPEPSGRNMMLTVLGFDLHRIPAIGEYIVAIMGR